MKNKSASFLDKIHLWFLILVGGLIIVTLLWGDQMIDLQFHDAYFVISYGSVNGIFIAYFLIVALIYYRFYRKGYYLSFQLNFMHVCFSVSMLLQLANLLEKCSKATHYQERISKLSQAELDVLGTAIDYSASLAENLFFVFGWVLLGMSAFVLNIIRYGKEKQSINMEKDSPSKISLV